MVIRWFLAAMLALGFIAHAAAQTNVYPPPLSGQARMTATGSSAGISAANLTLTTASGSFPAGQPINGYLRVKNAGSSTVYVCWFGGTCASTTGEPVAAGEAVTKWVKFLNFGTTPPSVIAGTGSQSIEVEW